MSAYKKLIDRFKKTYRLNHAMAILSWDEAVIMPINSGEARAESLATLKGMEHELLVANQTQDLISQAKIEKQKLSNWQQRDLELIEKRYQNATCFDTRFVENYSKACMNSEQAWRRDRANNDWLSFKPFLSKVIDLTKEKAQRKAQLLKCTPYDALLDEYSPGINQAMIDPLFSKLQDVLPNMVNNVLNKQAPLKPFQGEFEIAKQKQLGKNLMDLLGFDFSRGRLDVSHHPFCGGVSEDVRITTRYQTSEFISSVMGVCHETGHALYEFGLPKDYSGQLVGESYGMTVHESQSLFMEMQICRSKPFMALLSEQLNKVFGDNRDFDVDNIYHHYTHVENGLIRVYADELTYPLHIILRYEMEKDLIVGNINVDDLPDVWHQHMSKNLGLSTLGNDKDGVMQDVHWPCGAFGYFPAYTLGALVAAQLAKSMQQELAIFDGELNKAKIMQVGEYLRTNIHQWGAFYNFDELIKQATGKPLAADDYLQHIEARYAC